MFYGFLDSKDSKRKRELEELKDNEYTIIFYEAPHKLIDTLSDLYENFGERKISLCRELTKLHEEVIRTTLSEAVSLYDDEKKPRGEYVLIIEGANEKDLKEDFSIEDAAEIARKNISDGMKPTDACKLAAKKTGFSKGEIYSLISSDKT